MTARLHVRGQAVVNMDEVVAQTITLIEEQASAMVEAAPASLRKQKKHSRKSRAKRRSRVNRATPKAEAQQDANANANANDEVVPQTTADIEQEASAMGEAAPASLRKKKSRKRRAKRRSRVQRVEPLPEERHT